MHLRDAKRFRLWGYPLLATPVGVSRQACAGMLSSCPARLNPSRSVDLYWRRGTASSLRLERPMYMVKGALACLGFRVCSVSVRALYRAGSLYCFHAGPPHLRSLCVASIPTPAALSMLFLGLGFQFK